MSAAEAWLKALDDAHWELSEALLGMPDDDLWRRADPRLLSVGELVAHMAYGEANNVLGDGFESPLLVAAMRYYPYAVEQEWNPGLTTAEVQAELERVHAACRPVLAARLEAPDAKNPQRDDWTWGYTAEYMAFHVAYHTGQIVSVRHLLGHETTDN